MTVNELGAIMRDNGIVGAGGAGFPSYAKLNNSADTLILNCAECEPLLKLHKQLLAVHTEEVLCGLETISRTLGIKDTVVAVKGSSQNVVDAVTARLGEHKSLRLHLLEDVYPAGDELILTCDVTGRTVAPGKIPATVGVIVYNVETVYNTYLALNGSPVTHKYVTVSGEVGKPATLRVPLGMKFSEVAQLAGGIKIDDPFYISGGPMMGRKASGEDRVVKNTNGILVLERSHPVAARFSVDYRAQLNRAKSVCCQCSYCTDMCPRALLGHPIEPNKLMLRISNTDATDTSAYLNSMYCSGCGLCEVYACQQGLSPRSLMFALKGALREKGVGAPVFDGECETSEFRDMRKVPMARLKARLRVDMYDRLHAPLTGENYTTRSVRVMLRQGIGAPASPTVKKGDTVSEGQLIAQYNPDKLGVNLHAPIDGKIKTVTADYIDIG